ncbi:hypothetical protein ACFQ6V_24990 [Streptomyces roseifaciens]
MTDRTPTRSAKDPRFPPVCTPAEDFYDMPHEKLQAMVEHADQHRVIAIGLQLNGAAQAIKKLGDDLKKHMEGVAWSGEAGEAFRKWGYSMANETIRLSDYVKAVDKWMGYASTDLGSARRMPKHSPEDKATVEAWLKSAPFPTKTVPSPTAPGIPHDPVGGPTQVEAYNAQERLETNHKAAAALMKALAESYDQSGTQILRADRPNFRPMPERVMPNRDPEREGRDYLGVPGGGSGGPSSGGAAGVPSAGYAGYAGGASVGGGAGGVSTSSTPAERLVRRPELDLSGGVDTPHRVPVPQPDRPPATPLDAGKPQIPVPHVPAPNWPGPERRPGTSRRPDSRLPNVPRDGIAGGRPTPRGPSVPTQNPGRVPVFGTEPSLRQGSSRPPMPAGPGFGGMPGPTAGTPGAGGTGRYKVTEPGGGSGGLGRGSTGGGSTHFTPGGTGLVRGGAAGEGSGASSTRPGMAGGFMPAAGTSSAASDRRTGGRRPDYLVEDEETWQQGGRNVVPPVIE